jgi:uncharacterized integral membrane protein (TIGR00698 family)
MININKYVPGLLLCSLIALPAWLLGKALPVIGGPVIALLAGAGLALLLKNRQRYQAGINFCTKKILQAAVVLLGFGLNLFIVLETGRQSLPVILSTISVALLIAFLIHKALRIPASTSILVGVGSAICGGSAIAATAPVIRAKDEEIAQAISVIFFFNVIAAIIFPTLGAWLGFPQDSGDAFGLFAGTAINDTSSVTAAAATWDSLYHLGSKTLDHAVTVKLTRTLAIIPLTLGLAILQARKESDQPALIDGEAGQQTRTNDRPSEALQAKNRFSLRNSFPLFILFFILACLITTVAGRFGLDPAVFSPLKSLSKFFIVMAMAAIGLNTDLVKMLKRNGKPLIMGFCCWLSIILISLAFQLPQF